jgi:hypothetical protein
MESELDITEQYQLNRLVYVNSANHAYSEIMLNSNIAMFGDNNVGKTASLAGMKLLLYPEVDFYNCENKFIFKGKNGLFSMEESYSFYFPDARSFIILEVINPEGTFCMVLYKRNEFGYGRFFVPVEYESLRTQFWNSEAVAFVEDISIQSVRDFVTTHDGIQVTDSNEIVGLMYSSFRDIKAKKRFCVLPLKDDNKESIIAFRSIYQLAFEVSNLDDDTLPNAIATLLEMNRGRAQEKLDADLTKLSEQHSELNKRGEWLQALSNSKPLFQRITGHYSQAQQALIDYSKVFYAIQNALGSAKSGHALAFKKINEKYLEEKGDLKKTDGELKTLDGANREKRGELKGLKKQLTNKSTDLQEAKSLRARYTDTPVSEIISILEAELEKEELKLKSYQEEGGIKKLLQVNMEKRNALIESVKKLKGLISDTDLSLSNQLGDPQAASVLYSINQDFFKVSKAITENEKITVTYFTQLFSHDESGALHFLNQPLGDTQFSPSDYHSRIERLSTELKKKEQDLIDLNGDIEEQNKAIKNDNLSELIDTTKQDIEDISDEIKAISGLSTLDADEKNLATAVNVLSEVLKKNEKIYLKDTKKRNKSAEAFQKISDEHNALTEQKNSFTDITRNLALTKKNMMPIDVDVEPLAVSMLTTEYSQTLFAKASFSTDIFNKFRSNLNMLLLELPHQDVDAHKELSNLASYDSVIQTYKTFFTTLEYDKNNYRDQVRSHNQLVSNQLNELKEAKDFLFNFVEEINKELNNKPISNLSEVKLHLDLNIGFTSLLDTLDKHDIQDDSLLEPEFYEALSKFVERYFNKRSRRLKMNDIISSVDYHYRLKETGEFVTKSQSGGTTTAITASVLSVLLKRMSPTHIDINMPIIVDEISVMDSNNTDSTIKQIMEHGFSIFCATPTFSATLSEKVGSWIMIDQSTIKQPLVSKCHFNVMPEHIESFGVK